MHHTTDELINAARVLVPIHALCHGIGMTKEEREDPRRVQITLLPETWNQHAVDPEHIDSIGPVIKDWVGHETSLNSHPPGCLERVAQAIGMKTSDQEATSAIGRIWTDRTLMLRAKSRGNIRHEPHARIAAIRHALKNPYIGTENERELLSELVEIAETIDQYTNATKARRRLIELGGILPWRGSDQDIPTTTAATAIKIFIESERDKSWPLVRQRLIENIPFDLYRINQEEAKEELACARKAMPDLTYGLEHLLSSKEPKGLPGIHSRIANAIGSGLVLCIERVHEENQWLASGEGADNPWLYKRNHGHDTKQFKDLNSIEHLMSLAQRAIDRDRNVKAHNPLITLLAKCNARQALAKDDTGGAWQQYTVITNWTENKLERENAHEQLARIELRDGRSEPMRKNLKGLAEDHRHRNELETACEEIEALARAKTPRNAGEAKTADAALEAARKWREAGATGIAFDIAFQVTRDEVQNEKAWIQAIETLIEEGSFGLAALTGDKALREDAITPGIQARQSWAVDQINQVQAEHGALDAIERGGEELLSDLRVGMRTIEVADKGKNPEAIEHAEDILRRLHPEGMDPQWIAGRVARSLRTGPTSRIEKWLDTATGMDDATQQQLVCNMSATREADLGERNLPGIDPGEWTGLAAELTSVLGTDIGNAIMRTETARSIRIVEDQRREKRDSLRGMLKGAAKFAQESPSPWPVPDLEPMLKDPENEPEDEHAHNEQRMLEEERAAWKTITGEGR